MSNHLKNTLPFCWEYARTQLSNNLLSAKCLWIRGTKDSIFQSFISVLCHYPPKKITLHRSSHFTHTTQYYTTYMYYRQDDAVQQRKSIASTIHPNSVTPNPCQWTICALAKKNIIIRIYICRFICLKIWYCRSANFQGAWSLFSRPLHNWLSRVISRF